MSGLVGAWKRDGAPVQPEELARMRAAMPHRGTAEPDGGGDSVGLQYLSREPGAQQPFRGKSGAAAVIDGRIDNREELAAAAGWLSAQHPDAAYVMAAYERWGEEFGAHLRGPMAAAVFDPGERRLLLARDVIGTRPLHYTVAGGAVVFASEIKALLAYPGVRARPDDDGLADQLMGGDANRADLTCFAGIRAVGAAEVVVFTASGQRSLAGWDFDTLAVERKRAPGEYVEELKEACQRAVRRALRDQPRVVVSVSGGLDSSALYCMAHQWLRGQGEERRLHGYSLTYPDGSVADEAKYLSSIEAQCGSRIGRIPARPGWLETARLTTWSEETPGALLRGDSVLSVPQAGEAAGCQVYMDGWFGDQVFGPLGYWADLVLRLRWGTLRRHLRRLREFSPEFTRAAVRSELMVMLWRACPERIRGAARQVYSGDRGDAYPAWYTARFRKLAAERGRSQARPRLRYGSEHARDLYRLARSRYYLRGAEEDNKLLACFGLTLMRPFTDADLIATSMRIPGEVLNTDGVLRGLFREAMRGILPEAIRTRVGKADFTPFASAGSAREVRRFDFGARPLSVEMGYVDGTVLRREVERMEQELRTNISLRPNLRASRLIGLELWLRMFFGGEASSPEEMLRTRHGGAEACATQFCG